MLHELSHLSFRVTFMKSIVLSIWRKLRKKIAFRFIRPFPAPLLLVTTGSSLNCEGQNSFYSFIFLTTINCHAS